MLIVSAIKTIVEGFGSIDPLTSKCAGQMRQKTGLCLEKGEDYVETRENKRSAIFRDGTVASSQRIDGDDDQSEEASRVAGDLLQPYASNEWSSTAKREEEIESGDDEDRARALRKLLESFGDNGNPDARMPVGSTVVVQGLSLPSLGVYDWQSYELVSVYDQGVDDSGMPIKISRQDLNEAKPVPYGYKRYVKLYSERYHQETGPVVVSPDKIQLVSVKDEVFDSLLMALPVFGFWTALAVSFANLYNERYGGNFLDALFRT